MKTRESLPRTTSSASRSGSAVDAEVNEQSNSIGEDQVEDLCRPIEDVDQDRTEESNTIIDADSTTQNFSLRGGNRSSSQPVRRSSQRSKKSSSVVTPYAPLMENGITWFGSPSSILESRLKEDLNSRNSSSGCKSKPTRSSRQQPTSTTRSNNNNNNNLKNNNKNHSLLLSKEELRREFRRSSLDDDDDDSSSLTLIDAEILELPLKRAFPSSEVVHLEDRREKKAKVKLKDIPRESLSPSPVFTTLPPLEVLEEDRRRRKDDKKEDKSKKKKLKHLEEENLSKRLYESRELLTQESRSNGLDSLCGSPQVAPMQAAPDSNFVSEPTPTAAEEDRRGVLRLKACGECGARHAGSGCPFTRPTQRLPDSCPLPIIGTATNGVIVAPPHHDLSSTVSLDETWRDPQRPGSPSCYSRSSLPSSLHIEMRAVPPPPELDADDDVSVMGVTTVKPKQVEVVVATKAVAKFTQLGPVVGVPVREKDIPDDFCMVNLWEVFGGETKRYLSTVDAKRSNWTRFLRPAPDRDSANLVMVPRQIRDPGDDPCLLGLAGEPLLQPVESVGGVAVFLVTTQDINVGDELVFWAHDPTLAWSRKKMEKTNCGGCNMRFTHPLFYRMHCSVFHDPNYSLTIRKYHCKVCGLAVLGKENIMRHAADQHEGRGAYQCQFCKKFFLRLNYLDMHRTYGCAANPQRTRPLCDFCGRKFCQPQKLKVHIKRMHSGEYWNGSSGLRFIRDHV